MSEAPAGFHPHASGLLVPDAHARQRRVITYDDWKKLDRALDAMNRMELRMLFRCEHGCPAIEKLGDAAGGVTLRCNCTDRVFTKAF